MTIRFLDSKKLAKMRDLINNDAEFKIAAKFFSNDVLFVFGEEKTIIKIRDGLVTEIVLNPNFMDAWQFSITASNDAWEKYLQSSPPPFHMALFPAMIRQIFQVEGVLEKAFAHFWPITRMMDLMRIFQNQN